MKDNKNQIAGNTTMLVLGLLKSSDMYGYQMIEELEKRSENIFTLKAGTLYPILHTLEQQGIIESYDTQAEGQRPRKYYRITEKGIKALEEKRTEWNKYAAAINQVLGGLNYAVK